MKLCCPGYYEKFRCLAGACPDTCCAGWEVVADADALKRWNGMTGPLAEKIRAVTEVEDGEYSFRLTDGRCPFLRDDLLCEIQCEAGEEALCRTCRRFPRWQADYGALREEGLSLSCPEAARLIMSAEGNAAWREREDPSLAVQPNDLDASLYLTLRAAREALLEQARDRALPMGERMAYCLLFAARLQKALRGGEDADTLIRAWQKDGPTDTDEAFVRRAAERTDTASGTFKRLTDALRAMERLTTRWDICIGRLEQAADDLPPGLGEAERETENLFVYYLERYFLEAAYDGNAYLRVKTAAVGTWLIAMLGRCAAQDGRGGFETRVDLAHLYAREVEHSQENLDALAALLSGLNMGGTRWLVPLVLS